MRDAGSPSKSASSNYCLGVEHPLYKSQAFQPRTSGVIRKPTVKLFLHGPIRAFHRCLENSGTRVGLFVDMSVTGSGQKSYSVVHRSTSGNFKVSRPERLVLERAC